MEVSSLSMARSACPLMAMSPVAAQDGRGRIPLSRWFQRFAAGSGWIGKFLAAIGTATLKAPPPRRPHGKK
jgi:hypothetical protein